MQKFYSFVVKNRIVIAIVFVIGAIFCLGIKNFVVVDYDIVDYLPEGTPSSKALDVMEDEFGSQIPNLRVMVKNVSVVQALEYKEKFKNIQGVSEVTWLDDSIDLTIPLEMQDKKTVETYYKDNNALFSITGDSKYRVEIYDEIRSIIGEDNAIGGSLASSALAMTSSIAESNKTTIFAVLFVWFMLTLTMNSWLDPLMTLLSLGIAIAINGGTNIIFGTISFVTDAAGNVLLLAVSLDYSVFLMHRFEECRKVFDDDKEAMVDALCKSTTSILSSGLTTVIGFLALCFMRFLIGPDLGTALAKGVGISLLVCFIFTPCNYLIFLPLRDKLKHKSFVPNFRGFGKIVSKITIFMLVFFLIFIIPGYLASNRNSYYYGASHLFGEETALMQDTHAIEDAFGKNDTYVLLVPKGNTPKESQLSNELKSLNQVTDIISFVDKAGAEIPKEYLDKDTLDLLESEHYSRMVLSLKADYEGKETFDLVEKIRGIANKYYPNEYLLAGEGVSTYDLMDTISSDQLKVNLVAIFAVYFVMVILQKDFLMPAALVISIESAIWINFSIPYYMGSYVFYIAYLIVSSIQLGATVDYAILMSDRYKEFRIGKATKQEAIIDTIEAVSVSILTSGLVLTIVGLLLDFFCSNLLLAQIGHFVGIGAFFSLLIVFFVLPGILFILDKLLFRKHLKIKRII